MRYLVLGSQGMLGAEFVKQLVDKEVIGWGRSDLDITNEKEVIKKISELRPDVIINCAAYNNVDKAEDEPEFAMKINGEAVGYLARAAAECGAAFAHFSTDYVFDGEKEGGYAEDDVPRPISKYGESKVLGEKLLLEYAQQLPRWYMIRTSKLFGLPGVGATSKKSFPEMMLEFARDKGRIEAIDNEVGSPTYVKDLAEAVLRMSNDGAPSGIYHLTNSGSCTWYEYAKAVVEFAGVKAEVVSVGSERFLRKAKRPSNAVLLNTKLPSLRPWQAALKEYLESGMLLYDITHFRKIT